MIEFQALGSADLSGPEGTDASAVLARPKLLALLSFLAVSRGFHRRNSLIGLFWADLDEDRARSAVRQSLYRIRLFLGDGVIVTRGDDEVALSATAVRCDVTAFEDALDREDREEALSLYSGDLLLGLSVAEAPEFEDWLDAKRKELRERASVAAWELAGQEATNRNTGAAGQWTRKARELSPLDERLARRVIKLLDRMGDRSGAIREYESFASRLANELDLEPSPETRALAEKVRERAQVADDATEPLPPLAPAGPDGLERALGDTYRIVREIGAGGMATVYLARDLKHDRDVAVKVMHPELASTVGAERFLREIKLAARLSHPHIVPLYDSGLADGYLYYVMSYAEGESLRDRLERDGQLPVSEAIGVAREVADGLDRAHSLGVVHRDIKPENILFSGGHALVADFGVAHAVSAASDVRLTRSGLAIGTPAYMSPEQGAGSAEVDGRSAIYSLACVLYEMLGGEPPFTGPSAESIARQHLTVVPRPIIELRPAVPRETAAALSRALSKTPADRFGFAPQFAGALTLHTPVDVPRSSRRSRRRVALLATIPAALIAVAVLLMTTAGNPDLNPNRVFTVAFENRTGDPELELLGSMAADWITSGLQQIDVIEIVPTATGVEPGPAISGLDASRGASQLGAVTGAGTVVAGAYYRRGDSLEFQTQVIDARNGKLLRAVTPVVGPVAAPESVMDSLRERAVAAVAAALDRRLMASTARSPVPSLEAYQMYLEGHRTFFRLPRRIRESLSYFYRAVELDSSFTDPRFFIVLAHTNLWEYALADSNAQLLVPYRLRFSPYQRATLDWQLALLRGDRPAALLAARARGVVADAGVEALRSNHPLETIEALEDLSFEEGPKRYLLYFNWIRLIEALHVVGEHERELREARRARESYPDRQVTLLNELRALSGTGNVAEVERRIDESLLLPREEEIVALDVMVMVAEDLRAHGHRTASSTILDGALAWLRSRPSSETESPRYRAALALTLYQAERWEEAETQFEELARGAPNDVNFQGYLGVLAARRGDIEEAERISQGLVGLANPYDFGRETYWQACIASQSGELDRAMVLLRESYARGRVFTVRLHADMDLEPLRDYLPYQEFMRPKG